MGSLKNQADYSLYRCPYSHVEKECGHELKGPEGYVDSYSIWCACGFRGPVFCLDPKQLKLELLTTKIEAWPTSRVLRTIGMDGKYTRNMYCSRCGRGVRSQKFCHECGHKLNWSASNQIVGQLAKKGQQ